MKNATEPYASTGGLVRATTVLPEDPEQPVDSQRTLADHADRALLAVQIQRHRQLLLAETLAARGEKKLEIEKESGARLRRECRGGHPAAHRLRTRLRVGRGDRHQKTNESIEENTQAMAAIGERKE